MKNIPIRHGELLLLPVDNHDMSGAVTRKNYIASHSETGHHHVLRGTVSVLERDGKDTFVQLDKDTEITHTKSADKHKTLPIKKGIYRLVRKKEYDPFAKTMREVWD